MTVPTANQIRRQLILSNGQAKFEVTTTIVDSGDLPFKELFVVTISDPLNPKSDTLARIATPRDMLTEADILYIKVDSADIRIISGDPFARVGNVSDITALAHDRTVAVQNNATEYLTTTVTLLYDTLVTADAAYRTILDRLSTLVNDYRQYMNTFATNPSQNYPLPQTSVSVESEYEAIYREKKTATKDATETRDARASDLENCEEDGAATRTILEFLVSDIAVLQQQIALVTNMTETGSLIGGTCTTSPTISFNNVVKTFILGPATESSQTLLTTKQALYQVKLQEQQAHEVQCQVYREQLAAAEAAVTQAQRAEAAALGQLLRICPTFNPNTVVV